MTTKTGTKAATTDGSRKLAEWAFMACAAAAALFLTEVAFGPDGLLGPLPALGLALYLVLISHLTITAMSLSFHRQHTHQGVRLARGVDLAMQVWLWLFTSMSKRDWVSVHVYHHAHSDQPEDPHSPVQRGFWRVFALGVLDYTRAKRHPEVLRIRARIPESRFEAFIDRNLFLGPIVLAVLNLAAFGPLRGALMAILSFAISPLFAVGGVNALAHWVGYRNHRTRDNSRNVGFLLPLNWVICGELDHNNHHASPKSCSFRHRWYELDIGYVYLRALAALRLAEIKVVYRPRRGPAAPKAPRDTEGSPLAPGAEPLRKQPALA